MAIKKEFDVSKLTPGQQIVYNDIHYFVNNLMQQEFIGTSLTQSTLQDIEKRVKYQFGIDIEAEFFGDDSGIVIIKPFVNQLLELDSNKYSID